MDRLDELRRIDERIASIPQGTIEIHPRGGDKVAYRVAKEGRKTRFVRLGLEGGPEHIEAVHLLEERRRLSRRRRDLAREIL